MNEDRIHQLRSEALESARKWENLVAYHTSQNEVREAAVADSAAVCARRYAEIMQERLPKSKVAGV